MGLDQIKLTLIRRITETEEPELLEAIKNTMNRFPPENPQIDRDGRRSKFSLDLSKHPGMKKEFNLQEYIEERPPAKLDWDKFHEEATKIEWDTTVEEDLALLKSMS